MDLNNLDKSNWKTYRFDEIAQNIDDAIEEECKGDSCSGLGQKKKTKKDT